MKESIIFVGLDVDDKNFHGSSIHGKTGEQRNFKTKANLGSLLKKLKELESGVEGEKEKTEIRVCYEASYLGYSLQRSLTKAGYKCEIAAPSLIPRKAGKRVKTDRVDSEELARYYIKGDLTMIHIPGEKEEMVRNLIRGRSFLKRQSKSLKQFILSECRQLGWHYKQEEGKQRGYWTGMHHRWLEGKINKGREEVQYTMKVLLMQLDHLESQLRDYGEEIRRISERPEYKEKVKALVCYRGIGILTAMILITELGDIKRFKHPRNLTSYAGMDIREYSSGGKEKKYGMTRMGNKQIRTSVIEACQLASRKPAISRKLKVSRKGVEAKYLEIADRCMNRLYKKSGRLLSREKNKNLVKAACGREMLGFIWESLREAA